MATSDWWKKALADPSKIGGKGLPIHDGNPQPGFYRMRGRDGGDMIPVAIWENKAGEIVAKVGNEMAKNADDVWTWCCREPVREAAYRDAAAGKGWPDSAPPKAAPTQEDRAKPEPAKAEIGHNQPDDPFEALRLEVYGEIETAEELISKGIKSEDDADAIANLSKRMSNLKNRADKMFDAEKEPWRVGGKKVDDKFRDVRGKTEEFTISLKRILDKYLKQKKDEEAARVRRAAEEAEAKRRAAEEAERKALQEAKSEDEARIAQERADRLKREAEEAEEATKARAIQAGRTGSKVSLRTFKTAKIVDMEKALLSLKDHEKVREIVQILANAAARSDIALPGCEVITEERAV